MERKWLIDRRTKKKLKHDEVANKVLISRQYYGMIESGVRNPSVELAKKIAATLKFDWTLFFNEEGNKKLPSENDKQEVI